MGRLSKRTLSCRQAIKTRYAAHRIQSIPFAFALIAEGGNYEKESRIQLWCNSIPPPKTSFNRALKKVSEVLEQMARESCQYYASVMGKDSSISFDGSWSQRREANHCIVDFFDNSTQKIVDFEIISRSFKSFAGNYEGPSNLMEIEGLKRLKSRWAQNPKVKYYIHDKDSKATQVFKDTGWIERYDKVHAVKMFKRAFKKKNLLNNSVLYGLKERLAKFLRTLINSDYTDDEKAELWINCCNHYCGIHDKCTHDKDIHTYHWANSSDEKAKALLQQLLEETLDCIKYTGKFFSTQMNESFHGLKQHYASKQYNWQLSFRSRMMAAILQWNNPDIWKETARKRLGITLSNEVLEEIIKRTRSRQLERANKQKSENKKCASEKRYQRRNRSSALKSTQKIKGHKEPINEEKLLAKKDRDKFSISTISNQIHQSILKKPLTSKVVASIIEKMKKCEDIDILMQNIAEKMILRFLNCDVECKSSEQALIEAIKRTFNEKHYLYILDIFLSLHSTFSDFETQIERHSLHFRCRFIRKSYFEKYNSDENCPDFVQNQICYLRRKYNTTYLEFPTSLACVKVVDTRNNIEHMLAGDYAMILIHMQTETVDVDHLCYQTKFDRNHIMVMLKKMSNKSTKFLEKEGYSYKLCFPEKPLTIINNPKFFTKKIDRLYDTAYYESFFTRLIQKKRTVPKNELISKYKNIPCAEQALSKIKSFEIIRETSTSFEFCPTTDDTNSI